MTVKKFYKYLHKAFPNGDIFVTIDNNHYWLAIPSTAMRKYGKLEVVDMEKDYDIENNMPTYFLKTKVSKQELD